MIVYKNGKVKVDGWGNYLFGTKKEANNFVSSGHICATFWYSQTKKVSCGMRCFGEEVVPGATGAIGAPHKTGETLPSFSSVVQILTTIHELP